jgi:hypothetical protein
VQHGFLLGRVEANGQGRRGGNSIQSRGGYLEDSAMQPK